MTTVTRALRRGDEHACRCLGPLDALVNGTLGPGDRRSSPVNVRRLVNGGEHEADRTSTRLFRGRELEHGPDALVPECRRRDRCHGATRQVETLDWEQPSGFRFQSNPAETVAEAANKRDEVTTEIIPLSLVDLKGSQRRGENRGCRRTAVDEVTGGQAQVLDEPLRTSDEGDWHAERLGKPLTWT